MLKRRGIIWLLAHLALFPETTADQSYCDSVTKVFVDTEVREYPILISTFVKTNTSFIVGDGVTVHVSNAPKSLSFVTKGRSMKRVTKTIPPYVYPYE